jgi:hypothetical protein
MRKRSLGRAWKVLLSVVALMATALALYVQIFERRSRQEEDRLAAVRLEEALGAARARLKAEILTELRAELEKGKSTGQPGDQPLPNAVLRRGETDGGRVLQQVLASADAQEASRVRFRASLDSLAFQMERSDRALRRDLEEIRREQDVSGKVLGLLLVALVPLVIHLLASLWPGPGEISGRGIE